MNQFYFIKKTALLAMLLLTVGCKQANDMPNDPEENEKGNFSISLVGQSTKAFYDDERTGEECEKVINNAIIFVYEANDATKPVIVHVFNNTELAKKRVVMSLPENMVDASKKFHFYLFANHSIPTGDIDVLKAKSVTDLKAIKYEDFADYNGTFDQMFPSGAAACLRSGGFSMSGSDVTGKSPSADQSTPMKVSIPVSRNVVKIASRAYTTKAFHTNYGAVSGSKMVVKKVEILNLSPTAMALEIALASWLATEKVSQEPNVNDNGNPIPEGDTPDRKVYQNIFYVYENGLKGGTPTNKIKVKVTAEFDFDGDPSTTNDISQIDFTTDVTGLSSSDYLIPRNSYLKLDIKLNGVSNKEIVADFTIADWTIMPVQDIGFGS